MDYVRHGKIQVGFKKDQIAALYFTMSNIFHDQNILIRARRLKVE